MKSMKLKIVTSEKKFYSGESIKLVTKSRNGSLGILANHIDMVAVLKPTTTKIILSNGTEKRAFTSTGILKVHENAIEIMCDACEWPEEIDFKRAEEAKVRAQKRLEDKKNIDVERAEASLLRAVTRMSMKNLKNTRES